MTQLVEVLRYKPEGGAHDFRWCHWNFSLTSRWGNRREGDHWGDLGLDGWIILGWISRRWGVGIWTGLGWPNVNACECGYEPSGSVKCGEFLD